MALVGEMQYLTIGNDTYSLPTSGGGGGGIEYVGLENATNGGLTVSGSPLTADGTITVGHSNVLTSAQSTSAVYPITIDKNGHIASYGSAVIIPTITLNGSSTTSPSFYAPTSAGTNGYVLTSNGSGAPSWSSISDSDENVKSALVTTGGTYYIVGSSSSSTNTSTLNKHDSVSFFVTTNTSVGDARLILGNSTTSGTNSKKGLVRLYGSTAYYTDIISGTQSENRTITLPNATGTVALTSDIPTTAATNTTGISIANHSTGSIYGVSADTTSVTGVQSSTTTASKVTVGTHSTDYGVTAAGSGSFTQGTDTFTPAILTFAMDSTTTTQLNITFSGGSFVQGIDSHTHTAPTLGSKVITVSASDVTVPIKATSATTVPIKITSPYEVVTSATHSITDNGHTHSLT